MRFVAVALTVRDRRRLHKVRPQAQAGSPSAMLAVGLPALAQTDGGVSTIGMDRRRSVSFAGLYGANDVSTPNLAL